MSRLLGRVLVSAAILIGVAGCASEEDTIVMAPLPTVTNQFLPNEIWSTSIGQGVGNFFSKLQPAFAYEKIFVASRDGLVKALDPDTGKSLWSTNLETDVSARLSGGLTASYGKLFIGSENGKVFALDAETGEELWSKDVTGEVLARPLAESNNVMIHTSRGRLIALQSDTGEEVWQISTEVPNLTLRGNSSPASVSGGVFWGTSNGRLAAAIIERGQLIWQQPVGTPKGSTEIDRLVDVDSSPIIIGGNLYIVGVNGQLISFDLRSASAIWKRQYSSAQDMATDGIRLFMVLDSDHMAAVDARSGTELWKHDRLENRLLTAPVLLGDNYLVVGDAEGYLHWIDKTSGEFVAQQFVSESGFSVPPIAVGDDYLVVTRDGQVKKLRTNIE